MKTKYEILLNKELLKRNVTNSSNFHPVIVEFAYLDTLNIKHYQPDKFDIKILKDGKYIPLLTKDTVAEFDFMLADISYKKDSLVLRFHGWDSKQSEVHSIHNNRVESFILESYNEFESFKEIAVGPIVHTLRVPARTVSFILSEPISKSIDFIYGEVEIITSPYYSQSALFKEGFIKKRYRAKCLFKIAVKDLR
ncbi:hypothetical protein GCM10027037_24920 [Mucilaginibacter koreensis]